MTGQLKFLMLRDCISQPLQLIQACQPSVYTRVTPVPCLYDLHVFRPVNSSCNGEILPFTSPETYSRPSTLPPTEGFSLSQPLVTHSGLLALVHLPFTASSGLSKLPPLKGDPLSQPVQVCRPSPLEPANIFAIGVILPFAASVVHSGLSTLLPLE